MATGGAQAVGPQLLRGMLQGVSVYGHSREDEVAVGPQLLRGTLQGVSGYSHSREDEVAVGPQLLRGTLQGDSGSKASPFCGWPEAPAHVRENDLTVGPTPEQRAPRAEYCKARRLRVTTEIEVNIAVGLEIQSSEPRGVQVLGHRRRRREARGPRRPEAREQQLQGLPTQRHGRAARRQRRPEAREPLRHGVPDQRHGREDKPEVGVELWGSVGPKPGDSACKVCLFSDTAAGTKPSTSFTPGTFSKPTSIRNRQDLMSAGTAEPGAARRRLRLPTLRRWAA